MLPPEEGVERFIYKEDKDTPLHILPSGSHGVIVTEANISTLCREGITFGYKNDPALENSI